MEQKLEWDRTGDKRDSVNIWVAAPGKTQAYWGMGDKLVIDASALEKAEVLKAILITAWRNKAWSHYLQAYHNGLEIWETARSGAARGSVLLRLNISQCMELDSIHFKGAGIYPELLKELPDVIMRLQSFICHPWQLEKE